MVVVEQDDENRVEPATRKNDIEECSVGRRKTPQEKKRNAYEKDVVSLEEYPKSKAVGRARAKAGANRAHRSKVKSLLSRAAVREDGEDGGVPDAQRKKVWKTQVVPLGEAVQARLVQRRDRIGWNFFKRSYSSELHREQFVAFLEPTVAGLTAESYEISLVFREIIDGEELTGAEPGTQPTNLLARKEWLCAFFEDAPGWETKLRNWIEELSALYEHG